MKFPRRQFLHLAAGAAVLPAVSRNAKAQNYPARPIRLIVGYTPGGSADLTSRLMGQWLSERLGQSFVVENRPGGGTNIATEAVVRAPPDGYTLLLAAPALTDLIAGQVHVMFDNIPTCAEHVKSGKLRGLAVTSTTRSAVLPDLPTVADFLPGYEASAWYGFVAPKNTPADLIDRLNKETNAVLADPAAKTRFAELGALLLPGSAADFGKLLADETDKWGKVVKFSGARVD
jgi:tripartite-type tricarboxylate transporter receptor subunit TctC